MILWWLALLLLAMPAEAQNFGNIKPHTVIGNPDPTTARPAAPMPFDTLMPAVSPKSFGAVCNGTTSGSVDTPAIQAAIAASNHVVIPQGCVITSTITLHANMLLEGDQRSRDAPYSLLCRTVTTDCLRVVYPNHSGVVVRNLSMDGTGQTAGAMLSLTKVGDFTLENVSLANGYNLVSVVGGNTINFNKVVLNVARGQYALKWDSDGGADGTGDQFYISDSLIACGYAATPANTADGILWDGNTHTLNITNLAILRCNHGVYVKNSRGLVAGLFPSFLVADNLQIEGAVSNAFRAESGSNFWITNSYLKNQPATAQGNADGPVLYLGCDAVAGGWCGSAPAGASVEIMISNTQIFSNTSGACASIDWGLTQITNSEIKNCSGTTHAAPGILYGAHANTGSLSNSIIADLTPNYAVQTTTGAARIRLKDNILDGPSGAVNDAAGAADGMGTTAQVFIPVPAGATTATANVGTLKQITTMTCTPSGNNAGGMFYLTNAAGPPPTITVTQANAAAQSYNCIAGGW